MADNIQASPAVNRAIAAANDVPSLVANLQQIDPALATQITGKALVASKSVYYPAASAAVVYLVARYSLTWDPATVELVSGLLALVATVVVSAVCRYVTNSPITSWVRKRVPGLTTQQQGT